MEGEDLPPEFDSEQFFKVLPTLIKGRPDLVARIFVDEILAPDLISRFDWGQYTIWPGTFTTPSEPGEDYHLEIYVAPKNLEVYGGPNDGAETHRSIGVDLGELVEVYFNPYEDRDRVEIGYRDGVVRIAGRYNEKPHWGITLVIFPFPQKGDDPNIRYHYHKPTVEG